MTIKGPSQSNIDLKLTVGHTVHSIGGNIGAVATRTGLEQAALDRLEAHPLWMWIRLSTERTSFNQYNGFLNRVLCATEKDDSLCTAERRLHKQLQPHGRPEYCVHGVEAYDLLKTATEAFLLLRCGCACVPFDLALNEKENVERLSCCEKVQPAADAPQCPCDEPDTWSVEGLKEEVVRVDTENYNASESSGLPPPEDQIIKQISDRLEAYLRTKDHSYIQTILEANFGADWRKNLTRSPFCSGKLLCAKVTCPCLLELIWSYWHDEGMLMQTMNAISLRFQNRRRSADRDPLAELAIDPLRPLNNFLWGYIQDEQHRLSVARRAYEYSHEYGLALEGRALRRMRPADNRSKFLAAFHDLMYRCSLFFHEDADTTVKADGFPVLNALKEVHLLLAEGAHNQYGDLPWTARVEMMMSQWLLSRPEMREFLGTRVMVPYTEAWMGRVDSMKKLQGWTDVGVTHFRDLGVFGERLLLSVRLGNWAQITDEGHARTWARYWKPEIQGYIHAYRATTGVDLTSEPVDNGLPAVHLYRRLQEQRSAI